ncbi:MAG: hypothetical protein HY000_13090 [Planctomycetes bacterium]|nr:hypothetical protein [Planctomycetota bacterium]
MNLRTIFAVIRLAVVLVTLPATVLAQQPPYDVFPPASPQAPIEAAAG